MRLFFLSLSLLLLTACNTLSGIDVPENFKENLPSKAENDVPVLGQYDGYSCATTSLAMVMSFHDKKRYNANEVWDKSGSSIHQVSRVCGNDMNGLRNAAEWAGFEKHEFITNASVAQLKYLVSQGLPVVINIHNFFSNNPRQYHAVVVAGYDGDQFLIRDPQGAGRSYKISEKKLEKDWYAVLCSPRTKRADRSMFVLYPKKA
ncbi:C39 family peptidase [Aliamphritea hakodatensis]|uniref:C39 family peptidase n=1 Tax=Aliamphritea hakodatensis TaxID=2895352 RepID=UPI0022FD48DA|nr:C39 family peptidase [Aliamphritea hakodatensis]